MASKFRLERRLLHPFTGEKPPEIIEIKVPAGSRARKAVTTHDAVHIYYEVNKHTDEAIVDKFSILTGNNPDVPENAELFDIVDIIVELAEKDRVGEETQGIVFFPIYRIP